MRVNEASPQPTHGVPRFGHRVCLVDGVGWRNPRAPFWTRLDELYLELDPKGREEDL